MGKDKKLSARNIKSLERIQKIVSLYLFETFLRIRENLCTKLLKI